MKDKMVIKIYGDSLSLPRPQDGVNYGDEYALIVQRDLAALRGAETVVYNRSKGGATVKDLASSYRNDRNYMRAGGVVVIQCGVVDCAPRPLPAFMRSVLGYAPGLFRKGAVGFLHRNRAGILRAGLGTRLTSKKAFERIMKGWLEETAGQEELVLVVNIAPTTEAMEEHSPGFQASIDHYNGIITESVESAHSDKVMLIDVNGAIKKSGAVTDFVNRDDGHHITAKGHELYAGLMIEKIPSFQDSDQEKNGGE